MPGRGDNNKHGSAGRGSNNQSNQPFVNSEEKQPRSDHNKQHTGGEPSIKQEKKLDADAHRDTGKAGSEQVRPLRTDERNFNLVVDGIPYLIKASPFSFNEETRFYITVNDGPEHVFTWDSELKQVRAIDDDAALLPDALEAAISARLQGI